MESSTTVASLHFINGVNTVFNCFECVCENGIHVCHILSYSSLFLSISFSILFVFHSDPCCFFFFFFSVVRTRCCVSIVCDFLLLKTICTALRSLFYWTNQRVQRTSWRVTLIFIQCGLIPSVYLRFFFFGICLELNIGCFLSNAIFKNIIMSVLFLFFYATFLLLSSKWAVFQKGVRWWIDLYFFASFFNLAIWNKICGHFSIQIIIAHENETPVARFIIMIFEIIHELMPQSTFLDSVDWTMSFLLLTQL